MHGMSRLVDGDHRKPVVSPCLCVWSDLLGFGAPLISAGWRPEGEVLDRVLERVDSAYRYHCVELDPLSEFALVLNDGVVRTLNPGAPERNGLATVSRWLRGVVRAHIRIKMHEARSGQPGPRTVLAAGVRIEHLFHELRLDDFVFDYTKQPTGSGLSAIAEQLGNPVAITNPGPLQLNFAFSKAYILDAAGSRSGIAGANFFVDESVIAMLSEWAGRSDPGYPLVDRALGDDRLVALEHPSGSSTPYLTGLVLERPVEFAHGEWSTRVYRLKKLYLWDEDPASYHFDLDAPDFAYVPPSLERPR